KHLDEHLAQIPQEDRKSRAILEQMRIDEEQHSSNALAAGGQGVARMLFLVDTHLLEDGTGFPILLGNLRQVVVQML
ncbi:demethoxyubiquinone hydroxylase family protein, partial [Pseudomonas aeruginosa]